MKYWLVPPILYCLFTGCSLCVVSAIPDNRFAIVEFPMAILMFATQFGLTIYLVVSYYRSRKAKK